MKKLRLEIDRIRVESFPVAAAAAAPGTVMAHGPPPVEDPLTIDPCRPNTDWASCGQTCEVSCAGSCYDTCIYLYTCADTCAPHCFPPAG